MIYVNRVHILTSGSESNKSYIWW